MSKKFVKLGIVGLGRGRWVVTEVVAEKEVKLTAICDINEEKLEAAKEDFESRGVKDLQCFTDFDEMLKSDIEAVFIATDAIYHVPFVIKAMEAEIAADPDVKFFLATDDKDEETLLRKTFPGKIVSNENRTLRRDSLDGMYDALLDLFCLAACKKIIGSYCSSFTDTAASLGNIPKLIAGVDK